MLEQDSAKRPDEETGQDVGLTGILSDLAASGANENLSLKNRVRKLMSTRDVIGNINRSLKEKQEAERDQPTQALFTNYARGADELGIEKLSFERSLEQARKAWQELGWNGQEEKIREWAKEGDDVAQNLVTIIDLFQNQLPIKFEFQKVIEEFERPLRPVIIYPQLRAFLESKSSQVQKISNPRSIPDSGVSVPRENETDLFLPQRGSSRIVTLGWQFVKEAADRCKENYQKLLASVKKLDERTVPWLNPVNITDEGAVGIISLRLGDNQRSLIEVANNNGKMMAREIAAVGVPYTGRSEWVLWCPERDYIPLRGNKWPRPEIPVILKKWENAIRLDIKREDEALLSVTSISNLPENPAERSLTKLIKAANSVRGEGLAGTICLVHKAFEWNGRKDIFAPAIAREPGKETLILAAMVTNHGFPMKLVGQPLPDFIAEEKDGAMKFWFDARTIPQEYRNAYKMLEKRIQMRLNSEAKAFPPAPKSEPEPKADLPAESPPPKAPTNNALTVV